MKFATVNETLGYVTAESSTNTDPRNLVAGSKNVIIDRQRKVAIRPGYSRYGAANTALTPIRNAWTWNSSTGLELPQRFYDDELEVYLGTVDTLEINAWTRVANGWSTTATLRPAIWFDATEQIDLQIMVQGDDNLYEWSGAVAVVSSITASTVTKKGTATFAENRFYTARDMTFVCVRTGTEYTYTGGADTTTLTGIADTTGLQEDDILVQKVVTYTDTPSADRNNHTIYSFENQIVVGSSEDNQIYISKNTDIEDYTPSSPRVAGEGEVLTLDAPNNAIASLGSYLLCFSGRSSIFRANYEQVAVSTTLAETLSVKKVDTGVNQSALNQECVVPIGNALAYISFEPALRIIDNPDNLNGINPVTLSNPIKPDFDEAVFTNASMKWWKNALYIAIPSDSRVFIVEFVQDADGKTRKFWQAPQVLPVRAFSLISEWLYGHSNLVPETYKLMDSDNLSDISSDDEKLPIEAVAAFSYRSFDRRGELKNHDEFYVEGEIRPNTDDLLLNINYDFGGQTQTVEKYVDGTNEDILLGNVAEVSLGQQSLGRQPIGGIVSAPADARKFRVVFEMSKEDYYELQAVFSTAEIDRYWAIIAHGPNAALSKRVDSTIRQ